MEKEEEKKTTNYDLLLELNRISDLTEEKCQIKCHKQDFTGVKVGVVGFYNVGKTFFINSLAGENLPNGFQNTTDFLALKEVLIGDSQYILFDSAGKGQPVDVRSPSEHTNRAAVEDLLDCILADLVDYFIIVINDLTHQDQLFITKIADFFSNNKQSEKRLIVIHNWKHVRVGGIISHFKKYVEPMYDGKTNKSLEKVNPENGEFFSFNTKELLSGSPIYVDHFFIVGEKSVDDLDDHHVDFEKERAYNRNVFNHIRAAFGHWFHGMRMHEKYDIVDELKSSFNRLGGKYFTAEKEVIQDNDNNNDNNNTNNINNNNNDKNKKIIINNNNNDIINDKDNNNNVEKGNSVVDIKTEFEIKDSKIALKRAEGYLFKPKTFPIFVMLSQFPTSLNTPKVYYEKEDENNRIDYMIAHAECPGLTSVEINTDKHKYWLIKLKKEPLAYQIPEPNVSLINDRTKAPSYGSTELMIAFPEDFVPDVNNYRVYYDQGVLVVQILHQRLNGIAESLQLLPWNISRNISSEIRTFEERINALVEEINELRGINNANVNNEEELNVVDEPQIEPQIEPVVRQGLFARIRGRFN